MGNGQWTAKMGTGNAVLFGGACTLFRATE